MCFRSLIIVGCLCALGCGDGSEHQSMSKKSAKPRRNHAQMIWVEGGSFDMGAFESDLEALPREKPRHRVKVSGFYMDVHEVTNAQFAEFVTATGYVTVAEREVKTADGVFEPGSMVFESPTDVFGLRDHGQWWRWRKLRVGGAQRGQAQLGRNSQLTQLCTWPSRMPSPTRNGEIADCQQRLSGSMLRRQGAMRFDFLGE